MFSSFPVLDFSVDPILCLLIFVLGLSGKASPGLVQSVIHPADDMKEINAALGVGEILLHAGVDPLRPVTCNHFDGFTIFLVQQLTELTEYFNAEPFAQPDYTVAIHVVDHGDVAMTLLIAGFIHTESMQTMEPLLGIWFKPVVCCLNTVADCPPVDRHEFCHDCLGTGQSQKSYLVVEIRQKS